jgi:uncharacterized protein
MKEGCIVPFPEKIYEQSIGFLRIPDGINPLDKTGIHPESYDLTNKLLEKLNLDIKDINTDEFGYFIVKYDFENANVEVINTKGANGKYTLTQIVKEIEITNVNNEDE